MAMLSLLVLRAVLDYLEAAYNNPLLRILLSFLFCFFILSFLFECRRYAYFWYCCDGPSNGPGSRPATFFALGETRTRGRRSRSSSSGKNRLGRQPMEQIRGGEEHKKNPALPYEPTERLYESHIQYYMYPIRSSIECKELENSRTTIQKRN